MQHILVIDDDPAVTSLLKRGLSYEGFVVETAPSGAEGLTMAREHPADLVIMSPNHLPLRSCWPGSILCCGGNSVTIRPCSTLPICHWMRDGTLCRVVREKSR